MKTGTKLLFVFALLETCLVILQNNVIYDQAKTIRRNAAKINYYAKILPAYRLSINYYRARLDLPPFNFTIYDNPQQKEK